jgi:hypothetical protein
MLADAAIEGRVNGQVPGQPLAPEVEALAEGQLLMEASSSRFTHKGI